MKKPPLRSALTAKRHGPHAGTLNAIPRVEVPLPGTALQPSGCASEATRRNRRELQPLAIAVRRVLPIGAADVRVPRSRAAGDERNRLRSLDQQQRRS